VANTGPELVVAIVRPVGTSGDAFHDALKSVLHQYAYTVHEIKLSDLLRDEAVRQGREIPDRHEAARIEALMDEGDRLCADNGAGSAVALLGVAEIRAYRHETNTALGIANGEAADTPVARTAYVLDSLKRPAEVTHLRRLYGDHVLVVSLQASRATRVQTLETKIRSQRASITTRQLDEIIDRLIDRDLRETDVYGQNTMRAFPMADVFIDIDQDVPVEVTRVVDLLFDSPVYRPPTPAEFSMSLANVTSTRSAELGLKVGAALVNADDAVIGLGHNAQPDPNHLPEFDPSTTEIADLLVDTLTRLGNDVLTEQSRQELARDPDTYAARLLDGVLADSRLRNLIEFQRPVHAEMNALLAALRARADVIGGTMYVTAYPCHHCARHLVAIPLKVVYLEPYPKSRAEAMYGAAVGDTFHPFTGVAPRRYAQLFSAVSDRKDATGLRRKWGDAERAGAFPKVDALIEPSTIASREISALGSLGQTVDDTKRPPTENLSHPPTTLKNAGTGTARPAKRTRRSASLPPTSPAPRKTPRGGRS
jgi:deoxycytidylate deaminase